MIAPLPSFVHLLTIVKSITKSTLLLLCTLLHSLSLTVVADEVDVYKSETSGPDPKSLGVTVCLLAP